MDRPLEIETKYNASEVSLTAFEKVCKERRPVKFTITSGYDNFYSNAKKPDSFCRHRREEGKTNQLTYKKKLSTNNNYVRVERNTDLDLKTTPENIEGLLSEFEYEFNRSIFKNCFVYQFEDHVLSYYIVFNENIQELDRFIEIELSEDHPWPSEEAAWDRLTQIESEINLPGVAPRNRSKLSLYERYKK